MYLDYRKLKELRLEKSLTQRKLASKAGLPAASLSRWESGILQPSRESLEKLCAVLEVLPDSIVVADKPAPLGPQRNYPKERKLPTPPPPPVVPPSDYELSAARVLGVPVSDIQKLESEYSGFDKIKEYVTLAKRQMENIREFLEVVDDFVGKMNDRFLELQELKERTQEVISKAKQDADRNCHRLFKIKA